MGYTSVYRRLRPTQFDPTIDEPGYEMPLDGVADLSLVVQWPDGTCRRVEIDVAAKTVTTRNVRGKLAEEEREPVPLFYFTGTLIEEKA